ncbi:MAG TPA: SOS response-associated peptidase [Alphaproteobacteria bacterium]|nr:SOS response-associated peptidase [Alphaproteobacteria bacterium]
MCGRYSLTTPAEAMRRLFGFAGPLPNLPARYNIAPTQQVPIVRLDREAARELASVRWGLIPFWAKDATIGNRLINARAEGLAEKPSFRAAFRARRCLVPADGFYEWQATPRGKRPYRIGLTGGSPEALPLFAFAGLWEHWAKAADGVAIESCTIVTTEANELLRPIHERMPVILAAEDHAAWLDPATPTGAALALLKPYPAAAMLAYPVSTRVNSVRFDDALCIAPDLAEPSLL